MKKILIFIAVFASLGLLSACHDEEKTTWDTYTEWRELNDAWLREMQAKLDVDGKPYYETLIPAWNPSAMILIHYFNDRSETAGNLSPLYTSVVDVRYV